MVKKKQSIPVNEMTDDFGGTITVERLSFDNFPSPNPEHAQYFEEAKKSHRHDRHSFFLVEKGTVEMEIDFQQYKIKAPSIIYMHPNQVHRTIMFKNVTVASWAVTNENLHADYLQLLEDITPAKPLLLKKATYVLMVEALSLFMKFAERKTDKLYHSLLKDSCNGIVALVISQYLEASKPVDKSSRFDVVTKAFREALERNYTTDKRPSDYANKLNISIPYLNECVKNTTGHPVSHHIQQRVILEAKRLLHHSNQSVKEIAADLGYDDYPYFSRLFTKVVGITALAFRNKNLD